MDADSGQVPRSGYVSIDVPVQNRRPRNFASEEAKARNIDRIGEVVLDNVDDVHYEKIARLSPLDRDRSGQRVDAVEIQRAAGKGRDRVGRRGGPRDLPIERVSRLHDDGVTRLDGDHRFNCGVEAVVACGIIGAPGACQVNPERIGSGYALQGEEHNYCEGYEMKPVPHHRSLLLEVSITRGQKGRNWGESG